jgi:ATP-dependent RNA helicase RhlE
VSFSELGLSPILCTTIARLGYTLPTPIQAQAIPVALRGRDLMAGAETGTGKTAAFALPILQRLLVEGGPRRGAPGRPRSLVLAPTRELAAQVHESFRAYGRQLGLISTAVFGGVGMQSQIRAFRGSLDVVVATPGRLLDHMQQRTVDLSGIEILTIDEADRMLDMGFIPAIRRILETLPRKRHTLLFSATFVPEIKALARQFMNDPVEVQMAAANTLPPRIAHRAHPVSADRKRDLIVHLLNKDRRQTLIFCRTKHGSDRLCRHLSDGGFQAEAIHGNKSQSARTRSLQDFKAGRTRILVATDLAARGLDIEQLPMVINFDLPMVPQDYIHRIGRTGRAGNEGQAVSLVSREEQPLLRDIQGLLDRKVEIVLVEGFDAPAPMPAIVRKFRPRRSSFSRR